MIRTLRAFFLGCQVREKLLVVAFLAIAVVLWLSGFSRRTGAFWREQHRTTVDLAEQAQWIARSTQVDAMAQKAASRLDPAKTLDQLRLTEALQKNAADAGLRNTQSSNPTNPPGNGQFSVHTLDYTVRFTDPDQQKNWDALKKFYRAIQQRSPYVGIESFTLRPDPVNQAFFTLVLTVSSVEVTKTR